MSDRCSQINPDIGRILVAQFSMAINLPIFFFAFYVIPRTADSMFIFLILFSCKMLFGSWGINCTKKPIISQLAEPHKRFELRNKNIS